MTHRLSTLLVVAVTLAGCSKKDTTTPNDTAATTPAGAEGEHHGEHQGEPAHQHAFEGGVKNFHDVLSPLWHADAGEKRVADTCAASADLAGKAAAIEAEPVPAAANGQDDAWKTKAAALTAATKELETMCAGDRAGFDAAFTKVHDGFHALIEVAGEKHQ
jgi:hypothetical protein